jgi:hypothetical protein
VVNVAIMGNLARHLDSLAAVPSRASKEVAERITDLLAEQFEAGVDPYGNPWAPLAERTLRKHGAPPLQAEFGGVPGPMAEGTIARTKSGAGVVLEVPFPGGIHQTGASKPPAWRMPARKILPEGGRLPAAWKRAIEESVAGALRRKR